MKYEQLVMGAGHPYIDKKVLVKDEVESLEKELCDKLNKGRRHPGEVVVTTYFLTSETWRGHPVFSGIEHAINTMLVHGTIETWPRSRKAPAGYSERMSWVKSVKFVESTSKIECALVKIATPLDFFDKGEFPLAKLRMATQSEPFNAFVGYTARVIDYEFPEGFKKKFLGQVWPHHRIREYLGVNEDEAIIGTIVKPKWLPVDLFAESVTQAALAGAKFIKPDENLHLSRNELEEYVRTTVAMLNENGFDLSLDSGPAEGKRRILFAPHITTNPYEILEYAKVAVDNGANALMFSPHFAGDFEVIREIYNLGEKYRVPIYAHTAGMNRYCGDPEHTCGDDPEVVYLLAGLCGAAFMQLPALGSYIRPMDIEKKPIIERLRKEGLEGNGGMTLVIAGGLSPENIGHNIKILGSEGRMFLAGTSVFHHPGGIGAGVEALKLAVEAGRKGIFEIEGLRKFAQSIGEAGHPLLRALGK